ncbi:MAG: hypothetical protein K2N34_03315, partial [Lachnospiraceae bacterium]|nr:hypothetical protein [Lachnospiraceae bacterium]
MEKKYRRITAVILILIMVLSLGIGTKTVKVSAAMWTLDVDREAGIAQIQEYIPDYNFAQAVYDSLQDADYMGDGVQSVKEVLETFEGDIIADGFKRVSVYTVSAWKLTTNSEIEQIEEEFDNREDAEAFYLTLADTQEYRYLNKKIDYEEKKSNEQKDENDLIHDISGIEWLRKANSIDISYNKITDLSILDINYLKTLEGAVDNGEKWFGSFGHNLYLDFRGNPIRKYPAIAGGRLDWPRLESAEFVLAVEPYVIVKEDESDRVFDFDIHIPLIEREGERINIKDNGCKISSSDIEGVSLDENRISNEVAHLMGATYSGNILIGIESAETSTIGSYVASESDLSTIGASTLKFLFNQSLRIYSKVKANPSEINANITLEKSMAGSNEPVYVEGAVYRLYNADIVDGSYVKGDLYSDTYYTTDANGKITIEETLPAGDYCLVEEEAPENYILDDTPIGFSLGGTVSLTGGTAQLTTADGDLVEAALNVTYIDRFSPDVSLEVTPEEGQRVKKIILTYFDREQQDYKTLEFLGESAALDVQNFINTNKGNEEGPGLIDGSVTIQAVFEAAVDLRAENQYKTGDLKVSKKVSGNGASRTKDFNFTVTLGELPDGTAANGEYGEMIFTNGVANFTLHDGESRMASNLPVGITYNVTEEETDGYTTASTGETGTIIADEVAEAEFTNTIIPGNLLVTKKVEGEGGDTAKDFRFTVTLGELSDGRKVTGEYGEMTFTEGVAEFTLHDGESRMAEGLPVGINYTVTEEETQGYRTDSANEEGIILAETTIKAEFTNTIIPGNLLVTKKVEGEGGDTAKDFRFIVILGELSDGRKVTGEYGEMTFTEGVAEFT